MPSGIMRLDFAKLRNFLNEAVQSLAMISAPDPAIVSARKSLTAALALAKDMEDLYLKAELPDTGAAVPPQPPVGQLRKITLPGLPLEGAQLAGIPEIEFDTGQATLKRTPQNDMVLNLLLRAMNTYSAITRLRVEGHLDSTGNETDKQRLCEARAIAVVDWLTTHGVDRRRLNPVGCASRDPLLPNDTPDHMARNSRIEFDIETIEDQPVEGGTEPCAPNPFRHIR